MSKAHKSEDERITQLEQQTAEVITTLSELSGSIEVIRGSLRSEGILGKCAVDIVESKVTVTSGSFQINTTVSLETSEARNTLEFLTEIKLFITSVGKDHLVTAKKNKQYVVAGPLEPAQEVSFALPKIEKGDIIAQSGFSPADLTKDQVARISQTAIFQCGDKTVRTEEFVFAVALDSDLNGENERAKSE